jgi:hypothetical protein
VFVSSTRTGESRSPCGSHLRQKKQELSARARGQEESGQLMTEWECPCDSPNGRRHRKGRNFERILEISYENIQVYY